MLAMEEVRAMCHMKVFVDTDDDLRLARRLKRDTVDRGRSVDGVITQYTTFVKPMFDTFVSPSKKYADIIIPWAQGQNTVAIDLIVQHIRTKLGQNDLRRIYRTWCVLLPQFQIRGMHTIIRDREVNRSDFVFYSDRIIRLVVEHGLGHLPFNEKVVLTRPTTNTRAWRFAANCAASQSFDRVKRWRTPCARAARESRSANCSSSVETRMACSCGAARIPISGVLNQGDEVENSLRKASARHRRSIRALARPNLSHGRQRAGRHRFTSSAAFKRRRFSFDCHRVHARRPSSVHAIPANEGDHVRGRRRSERR